MSFVTPAVPPPSAPTDLPCALPSTSPLAATPESLAKFTLKELKERCRSAGTPVTGSKADLITRLCNPTNNQKYKRKAGGGIKKPKKVKTVPKPKPSLSHGYGYSIGMHGGFGYYGGLYDDDDDEEEYCECCDRSFGHGELDPHNGLCQDCADKIRPAGGCGCWRMDCPFDPDHACFECDL